MNMIEARVTGKPARFHCDGKRISRAPWNDLMDAAYSNGTLCSLSTRAVAHGDNGGTKRWNYSFISPSRQR